MAKKQNKKATILSGKNTQQSDDPRLVQGRNAFVRADYEQAIHLWQRLVDSKALLIEKGAQVQQALAEAHFRLGQHILFERQDEALQHLVRSAELQPKDALYAYHAGLAYHRQGNLEAASRWYRQSLQCDPALVRAQQMLVLAQKPADSWHPNEFQDALISFQRMSGTGSPQPLVDALQACANGDWKKAASALNVVTVDNLPVLAQGLLLYYQGVVAYRLSDVDKAYQLWTKAFDFGLKTSALIENLTSIILLKLEAELPVNNLSLIQKLVQQGLSVSPENKRLREIDTALQSLASYRALETGDWEAVLAASSNSAEPGGPNARAALRNAAIANEKLEHWIDAAEAWREFARRRPRQESSEGWLTPEQVARLWERISGLYMRAGDPDEAIKTLQTALKYEPENPKLMLALARCSLDTGRNEAAQKQIDKLLAKNPNDIEALVLRAELAEIDPRRTFRQRLYDNELTLLPPGISEWEAVLTQNDETYRALAEERLTKLYDQAFDQEMFWAPTLDSIKRLGERALKHLPKNHFLRALYVQALLRLTPQGRAEAKRQIELIDLTDWDALHQLIDGFHMVDDKKSAAGLLQRAETLKPLDAEFYAEIGRCALHRRQDAIAEQYFDEAIKRSLAENERLAIPTLIGTTYLEAGQFDKAEAALVKALTVAPNNGPANFLLALLADRRHDRMSAKKYLREAERGARQIEDPTFLETVRAAKQIFNLPNMSLWDVFNQASPFLDDDLPDFEPFGIDPLDFDDDADFPPTKSKRRR